VRLAAQVELLEREAVAELVESAEGGESGDDGWAPYVSVPLAVNADALYTWLVDALVAVQADHRVTFELMREDQTRTAERLRRGDVMAAITSDPEPVPGCRVVRLGTMRYLGVATAEYVAAHLSEGTGGMALERAPLIAFDRSDTLQHDFLRRLTRRRLAPPVTWIPSISDFDAAVRRGMGWGMLPERHAAADLETGDLVEIAPGRHVDVPLFWQHWRLESPVMRDLTAAMVATAQEWLTA
jgi:LysR family transcriptional regulator, chromosome initiation inhibitor